MSKKSKKRKQNKSARQAKAVNVKAVNTPHGADKGKRPIVISVVSAIVLVAVILCSILIFNACQKPEFVEIKVKDYGVITVQLDWDNAPKTCRNFVNLANEGFYDGLTFHRIIEDFMIQGGDPKANGTGGSDKDIYGEFLANGHRNTLSHKRGVISMARSNDYDSASSQFFICNADSTHLDGQYAAFGKVVNGMEIVDKVTEDFVRYTTNGVITDKTKQPVIEYIRVVKE